MTDLAQEKLEGQCPDPGLTSSTLLQRCRARDVQAWDRLAHLYYPLIYVWCRRLRLPPEEACDICQEVCGMLVQNISRFRSECRKNSFRGWLWGITQNHLKRYRRQKHGFPQSLDPSLLERKLLDEERHWGIPTDEPEDRELVLHQALELVRGDFERRTWQAFWRTAVDGQPAGEVAAELQMTANAVYLAKSRVLRRLREELAGLIDL